MSCRRCMRRAKRQTQPCVQGPPQAGLVYSGHLHRLLLQGHTEARPDVCLYGVRQLNNVPGLGAAVIHQHQRLAIMHAYRPLAPALPAGATNQPASSQLVYVAAVLLIRDYIVVCGFKRTEAWGVTNGSTKVGTP